MAAPFIDDIQRIIDEQVREDFGLPPQDPKKAEAFRKQVSSLVEKPEKKKKR